MQESAHSDWSDEELILRYRQSGDNQWLGQLLERYTMLLLGVGIKYLKDRSQAQDAVQQVFIKAITNFPQDEIKNFKGWLYILMRNYCFGLLRSNTYLAPEEALAFVAAPEEKTREELISDELMLQQLDKALYMLNEEQQLSIKLFYLERRSYKEIMERTNFTFEQVKSFIQNGKRNLKLALQKLNKR